MPLGTSHVTKTAAQTFIPAIWSDEIVASYKKNLVLANLIKKISFKGKKGDTLHIPAPVRGSASVKAAQTQVTLIANTESEVVVTINKHYEYSRLIEDIVNVQALTSLRQFYTDDAGYALARQIDSDLIALGRNLNGGSSAAYAGAYIGGDGTTAYNSGTPNMSALTDAGIRRSIQRLDDNDVPMDDRFFLVPPSSRNTLMGIARFTENAFVGERGSDNTIRTGKIGDIYGIPVFVSTNCDTATGGARIALLGHRDWAALAVQQDVRSQTQYKQEYLATLYTADTLYGTQTIRGVNAVALAVPA